IEPESERAKCHELVAAGKIVALPAPERDMNGEQGLPLLPGALHYGQDRALEGKPLARHEIDREGLVRNFLRGTDSLDEDLGIAVAIQVDLLDAEQPREGQLLTRKAVDSRRGRGRSLPGGFSDSGRRRGCGHLGGRLRRTVRLRLRRVRGEDQTRRGDSQDERAEHRRKW